MNFLNFSRRRRLAEIFILIAAAAIFFVACSGGKADSANRKSGGNSNEAKTENPITVTTAKVEAREVPSFIQATGSLTAQETSDVAPKVAGKVVNVSANVGDFVGQGSVIARIDDTDARLRLAQAEAGVKQSIAGVRQAEARLGLAQNGVFTATTIPEVRAANANYEQAAAELKLAEANEARYRDLVKTGDVAMILYDQYRTARDTARARLNSAKQAQEAAINTAKQSNQAIKSAQAAVEAAQTQVGTAQQAITDTIIRAPFSGFVSNRPVAVGEYVSSASVVATILRTNPIKIQIQVSEADVPFVSLGKAVSVEVDAYKDRKFAGTVTAVNPAVDPTSRSATIEASIENNNNALRPGMFATARITKQGGNTGLFVPRAALYNDQSTQSYRVFVIQEGVAKLRVVQLGTEEGDTIQIINGVNADETIATSNLPQLYEGAKVEVIAQ
ncbi:MAG: efflux RND transporter periplasmic adaptor subunit [Acidobacteriota bacterium]|nr:efflux RND transporter periplasmic adaptor subunit [Acidobacteriota bacterium]